MTRMPRRMIPSWDELDKQGEHLDALDPQPRRVLCGPFC